MQCAQFSVNNSGNGSGLTNSITLLHLSPSPFHSDMPTVYECLVREVILHCLKFLPSSPVHFPGVALRCCSPEQRLAKKHSKREEYSLAPERRPCLWTAPCDNSASDKLAFAFALAMVLILSMSCVLGAILCHAILFPCDDGTHAHIHAQTHARTVCRQVDTRTAQSNRSRTCLLCLRSRTGWSNNSLPAFPPPERSYWEGNRSLTSARPLMLKPPDPLMLKPFPFPGAVADPLMFKPPPPPPLPPPLLPDEDDGKSSTPLLGRLFRNDLVLSMEMLLRAKRSERSSAFFASMAWLRRWWPRGLV